ncbi:hypothetical protein [Ramlibacter tataouinensis]|uniref:Uncharacterized protein n=1 Tax=Ramlibacter tataouinensis (strain ATCC BAA-407 / DSM 14655 / LMG 21543 / TTB310) TaxID=365046 RepID=F5XW23_RAMTT|nr:hypothetical protein [Ramlibacter tataouinensis]AEG94126.1 hypothetical protein Rta_30170 [Ramlibacter tataouinensis TTB310]
MLRQILRDPVSPLRCTGVVALVLALLLAQSLGLVHRVLHAPALGAGPAAALAHAHAPDHEVADAHGEDAYAHAIGWLAELMASHEESGDCRLFDQQSHGDVVLHLAVLGDSAPAAPAPLAKPALAVPATPAAPFHARGPPPLL